jgi:carboxypeptidase PM20D1
VSSPQVEIIQLSIHSQYKGGYLFFTACSPANTDLRRYVELSDHLYRITPTVLTPVTRGGIHGDDEQITVEHYYNFIRFYVALMLNADQPVSGHSASRHHREL